MFSDFLLHQSIKEPSQPGPALFCKPFRGQEAGSDMKGGAVPAGVQKGMEGHAQVTVPGLPFEAYSAHPVCLL